MSRHVMSHHFVISRQTSRDGHTTNASFSFDFFQSIQIKHDRVRWLARRLPIPYRISGIWSSFSCFWRISPRDGVGRILKPPDYSRYTKIHNSWKFGENRSSSFWEQTLNEKIKKLDYIPQMRYGIGTLRDNERERLSLIWMKFAWNNSGDTEALVV